MSAVLKTSTLYEQLMALPENLTGEIVDGRLYTQPRPAGPHAQATSVLGMDIGAAYHLGRGGPGGWWIIDEPELHFIHDVEVLVPDLAGWRRERMPAIPQDHRFDVVPDWVCEILSPSTQRKDRIVKMKSYARFGVAYCWLVDPLAHTLETFVRDGDLWRVAGLYQEQDAVSAAPFDGYTISLGELWGNP
ncbi:MAG: Uma2 family endonuclease [Methylococcales bacterium]